MLHQLTWQPFLWVALILGLAWYLLLLPFWYRRQLRTWLDRHEQKPRIEPLRKDWAEELEDDPEADTGYSLMGRPKMPEGVSRLGMNAFSFARHPDADSSREQQQSLIPDALEELKSIFLTLEKEQGTKDDFISLFGLVKAKYAAIRDPASRRALSDYIRENALFPISDEELTTLWN